jgi:single-strand DNA-binding protein
MPNLNRAMLIGHMGKDAELSYTASGSPVMKFSLAVSENRKKGDEWVSETEWFNIVQWGDAAERASEYLRKGNAVYVEGKLKTRTWDKNDGTKGYMTEVIADKVFSLEKREAGGQTYTRKQSTPAEQSEIDDLPFE